MGRVFIWDDPSAPSTYSTLLRRINTHLLIPTEGSAEWGLTVRVYRYRTDLKKPTEYDAIAEALEATLMPPEATTIEGSAPEKSLYLATADGNPADVWALLDSGEYLGLCRTDLDQVEQILVPKKDADYKWRQTVRIEGRCIGGSIRVGLVRLGTDPLAVWLEHDENANLQPLLPSENMQHRLCSSMQDYIECIKKEIIE